MRKWLVEALESRTLLASDLLIAEGEDPPLYLNPSMTLAFSSQDFANNSSRLGVLNPDSLGTPLQYLKSPSNQFLETAVDPQWSPDGNWILFTGESQSLFVINAFDGRMLPVLDEFQSSVSGFSATWAGGSNRISWAASTVFQNSVSNWDQMRADLRFHSDHVEATKLLNLTNSPDAEFRGDWNSDGTQFVYETSKTGAGDIYLLDLTNFDGVHLPDPINLTATRPNSNDSDPEFSPDGTRIAFQSSSGNGDIWVMNADGTNAQVLYSSIGSETAPTWSPDGSRLAFSSSTFQGGSFDQEIYIVNANGSGVVQATNDSRAASAPTWRIVATPPTDLSATVSVARASVENKSFTLRIEVHNYGMVTAKDVRIEGQVDARVVVDTVDGGSITDFGFAFTVPSIAVGETITRTVTLRGIRPGMMRTNVTVEAAAKNDPDTSNNTASGFTAVSPRNDDFQSAERLGSASGSRAFANYFASNQDNLLGDSEPAHAIDENGKPIFGGRSVWFEYVAPANGRVTFNTRTSRFDTLLSAYLLVSPEANPFLSRLASNDDSWGTASEISFNVSDGQSYYIAVDAFKAAQGPGYLSWSMVATVPPVPGIQHIQNLSRQSILMGSDETPITISGEGFSEGSRVYLYEDGQAENSRQYNARNMLQTIFNGDSNQLQTYIPKSALTRVRNLRLSVVRGNEESNVVTLPVTFSVSLPSGSFLSMGFLKMLASSISSIAKASGEGEDSGIQAYTLQGNVRFNDYFAVEGSRIEVQLNRANNSVRVLIQQGNVSLTNVPKYGTVTLWSGQNFEFTIDGEGHLTNLLRAVVETPLRDKGIDVTIQTAKLLLGTTLDASGRPIYGIEIAGSLKFVNMFGMLSVPVKVEKLILTQNEGMRFGGTIGPFSFGIPGGIGLENVSLTFLPGATPDQDAFRGSGKIKTTFFNAAGVIEVRNGMINELGGGLEFPAAGGGIPFGPLNITGGSLNVQNLLNLSALKVRIGADVTIGHAALKNVVGLQDVGIFYQLPASFGGDGSLEIFNVPAARAGLEFDLSQPRFTFSGNAELIPAFPIAKVDAELSVTASRNNGLQISGYAEGTVEIPNGSGGIYDVLKSCKSVWVFQVGPCMTFPYSIVSARLQYQSGAFSFSTRFPVIEDVVFKIRQARTGVEATVELFRNFPKLHTVLGIGGGEGETPSDLIGKLTVPVGTPKLIVTVSTSTEMPLYDLVAPDGTRYTPQTAQAMGIKFFQNPETNDSIYIIENPAAGEWSAHSQGSLSNDIEFEAWGANAAPRIDYLDVSPSGSSYDISYSMTDNDDDAKFSLYYGTSPTDTNGTLIVDNLSEAALSNYVWNAGDGSVPSGTYYLYAVAEDEANVPTVLFFPNPLDVVDPLAPKAPTISSILPVENALDVVWTGNSVGTTAGYKILYGVQSGTQEVYTDSVDAGTDTSIRLKGLLPDKTYDVTVVAYSRHSETDPFNPTQEVTRYRYSARAKSKSMFTNPSHPPIVSFTDISQEPKLAAGSVLNIAWTVFEESAVTDQRLMVSQDGGTTYDLVAVLDADARTTSWRVPREGTIGRLLFRLDVTDDSGNTTHTDAGIDFSTHGSGSIGFDAARTKIDESQTQLDVHVVRTGGSYGAVSVYYATMPGTALSGEDFEYSEGRIDFAPGETERVLKIKLKNDSQVEEDESFAVQLSMVGGGASLGANRFDIIISNDDFIRDSDADGIDDAVEDLAPNQGDGNKDGTKDSNQTNVASYHDSATNRGMTFVIASGLSFQNVHPLATGEASALPSFVDAIAGGWGFNVIGGALGQRYSVELFPHTTTIDTMLIYGSTARSAVPHWYNFSYANSTGTTYRVNSALIEVADGGRGDNDKLANSQASIIVAAGTSTSTSLYQNQIIKFDVSGDDSVSAIDALIVINELNAGRPSKLTPVPKPLPNPFRFIDPSGDNFLSSLDALLVINFLNNSGRGEGESSLSGDQLLPSLWEAAAPVGEEVQRLDTQAVENYDQFFSDFEPNELLLDSFRGRGRKAWSR